MGWGLGLRSGWGGGQGRCEQISFCEIQKKIGGGGVGSGGPKKIWGWGGRVGEGSGWM